MVSGYRMDKPLDRRSFLKTGAVLTGGTSFGFDLSLAVAQAKELKIARTTQTHSVCPYCAVGCGVILHTLGDRARNVQTSVVHVEGDPDNPINRGTLCPKGISLKQFVVNDRRLTQPQYRAPGSDRWQTLTWDDAIERIAVRIKKARDDGFESQDEEGQTVNRLANIALIGGCTDTNEIVFLSFHLQLRE